MKIKAQNITYGLNENNQRTITVTSNVNELNKLMKLKEIVKNGKELSVEIKQYRHSRSLDANAYMWVLLSKMAEVLKTTKDDLYLIMLERYGVFTHVVVKPKAVNRVKEEWRTVKELGPVIINGEEGIQLQCFFGSSTYDTKEMSVLIEGVVSECKEIGIETMTPHELASLKSSWGQKEKAV